MGSRTLGTATWTWTTQPHHHHRPDERRRVHHLLPGNRRRERDHLGRRQLHLRGRRGRRDADARRWFADRHVGVAAGRCARRATPRPRSSTARGTTGTFQDIPGHGGLDCGCPVTWPASPPRTDSTGVQTGLADLVHHPDRDRRRAGADRGGVHQLLQRHRHHAAGGRVTLDRIGTGADYAATTTGPVSVGLQSGNAAVSATDVNMASYGASLAVTRTFNSVEPHMPSISGWGWTSSLTSGVTTGVDAAHAPRWRYRLLRGARPPDGTNDTFIQGTTNGGMTASPRRALRSPPG